MSNVNRINLLFVAKLLYFLHIKLLQTPNVQNPEKGIRSCLIYKRKILDIVKHQSPSYRHEIKTNRHFSGINVLKGGKNYSHYTICSFS